MAQGVEKKPDFFVEWSKEYAKNAAQGTEKKPFSWEIEKDDKDDGRSPEKLKTFTFQTPEKREGSVMSEIVGFL